VTFCTASIFESPEPIIVARGLGFSERRSLPRLLQTVPCGPRSEIGGFAAEEILY